MSQSAFYTEILETLERKDLTERQLAVLKRDLVRKHKLKSIPTNIQIFLHADAEQSRRLRIVTKPVRSQSGVGVIALMTYPFACKHGRCVYCPGGPKSVFGDVPQSYTGNEPSSMRGIRNNYDSYLMTMNRLEQYIATGHFHEKIELIIMGGTFTSFPLDYQDEFIKYAFKALNDFSEMFYTSSGLDFSKFKEFFELPGDIHDKERTKRIQEKLLAIKGECSLEEEQKRNETSKIRCVALCLETRSDWSRKQHIDQMLRLGATRLEIGVQSLNDEVLEKIGRCHNVKSVVDATRMLKDSFLKVGYHMMPGLPGVSKEEDVQTFKRLFDEPAFRPDALKIYPTMVMPGTRLYDWWKLGEFEPLTTQEAAHVIAKATPYIPEYCRVMRVQRDIPSTVVSAGVKKTNLRQYLDEERKRMGVNCKCIRCREPKSRVIDHSAVEIRTEEYEASEGVELFISAIDTSQDILVGFCRARIPHSPHRPEIIPGSAGIRELHVYGQAAALGEEGDVQHRGYGKRLLQEAESLLKKRGVKKVLVISGIGVREYYRKQGYTLDGPYMSKEL